MTPETSKETAIKDRLGEREAARRASQVSDVTYELHLSLAADSEHYEGEARIRFAAGADREGIFLDFTGETVHAMTLNGAPLDSAARSQYRILLPEEHLGRVNELVVRYRNRHDNTGAGFHRFVDPEDGEAYVYTDLEPYCAHRVFPCFDQPDLKANYHVEVTAPDAWKVIANGRETSREAAGAGRSRRRFAVLPRFSTYLFAVIAGPFAEVRDTSAEPDLGLFCRKSLEPYLDAPEIFEVTRQGFEFYTAYFDQPYPFGKYDQIFVPEFNSGAMENVAAVTFNESQVFRDPPTETQRLSRAEVILHELAHMWFGNLVTMRWWDGLWLNESFATYISFVAMSRATRFEDAWENFLGTIETWALKEDQKPTTHPIAGDVGDTDQTFLNFDGITYGKGAATLKQLHATLGEAAFRDGLRRYFAEYAWGNATLQAFLYHMGAASGGLWDWARAWLETAGVNVIRPERSTDGASLTVIQEKGNGDAILRPHVLEVAGLTVGTDGEVSTAGTQRIAVEGARHVVALEPTLEDAAIYWLNHGDHAYARVFLDESSLDRVRESLSRITDPLIRMGLWQTLWEMTRDGALPPRQYLDMVARHAPREARAEVLETTLQTATAALGRYVAPGIQAEAAAPLIAAGEAAINEGGGEGDRALIWARALPGWTRSSETASRLLSWLDDGGPGGLVADQGLRWRIIVRASAFGLPDAAERLARELVRDGSDRGRKFAFAAEVARPTAEAKRSAFDRFVAPGEDSADFLRFGMTAFWWSHQREVLQPFVGQYFDRYAEAMRELDLEYATRALGRMLFPHPLANPEVLRRAEACRDALGDRDAVARRIAVEETDELGRAVRLRAIT